MREKKKLTPRERKKRQAKWEDIKFTITISLYVVLLLTVGFLRRFVL